MIKVGIVGVRGLSSMLGFKSIPEVEVVALCDLNEELLKEQAKKHGIPNTYRVFEDMLEYDIDAVVIATPMQFHVQQALQAIEAGKHVMSEVTAGVTMDELWWLTEWVEKYKKVYMMAENYCYIPENQLIENMVDKGLFGEVYFGEGEYIHDLKALTTYNNSLQRYSQQRESLNKLDKDKSSWRRFWQLGKRGAFYPTHSLGPVMKWFKDDKIKSVSCFGTGWHTAPEFMQEDTTLTLCQMESGKLIKIRIDCISNRPHNASYYSLQGTKGCYEAPRGLGDQHKVWIHEDGRDPNQDKNTLEWRPLKDFYDLYMPERYKKATEEQKAAGHWGGDYFIVKDFVDAILTNKKPPIDIYDACEWTAVGLLSELSVMNGGKTIYMPDFRKNQGNEVKIIKI